MMRSYIVQAAILHAALLLVMVPSVWSQVGTRGTPAVVKVPPAAGVGELAPRSICLDRPYTFTHTEPFVTLKKLQIMRWCRWSRIGFTAGPFYNAALKSTTSSRPPHICSGPTSYATVSRCGVSTTPPSSPAAIASAAATCLTTLIQV